MTNRTFSNVTDKVLVLIEPALEGIRRGGTERELADLQSSLRQLLVELMRLLERDPGIEAAVADLYDAAAAFVRDTGSGSQPSSRILRIFRQARMRFQDRLVAARPSEHGMAIVWRNHELVCA